jgi:hypothetical protein
MASDLYLTLNQAGFGYIGRIQSTCLEIADNSIADMHAHFKHQGRPRCSNSNPTLPAAISRKANRLGFSFNPLRTATNGSEPLANWRER